MKECRDIRIIKSSLEEKNLQGLTLRISITSSVYVHSRLEIHLYTIVDISLVVVNLGRTLRSQCL